MFPLATFRQLYPAFDDIDVATVQLIADQAEAIAQPCNDNAMMALTAHMLQLRGAAIAGDATAGPLVSTSVGGVSVTFSAPPARDAWSHWMMATPYGQLAAAMLKACRPGGMYVGGLPERAAFRKVGGLV